MPNPSDKSNINFRLPKIDKIVNTPELVHYCKLLSRPIVVDFARRVLSDIRSSNTFRTQGFSLEQVHAKVLSLCASHAAMRQQKVINATGILIHTNLGRSPIDSEVWREVGELNTGYSNLEINLESGQRGQRHGLIPTLLNKWIGSEDAIIVNNNAASLFLMLSTLAKDKEVIVSRGELVQIGGGFRIPDIMAATGTKLVEVGTTNITTEDDYLNAVNENTAAVLLVHKSNFSIEGFSSEPNLKTLVAKLPEQVLVLVDQGSGFNNEFSISRERSVKSYLDNGIDLICFSGDKLLGGPQSGVIAGKQALVHQLNKNPLFRTFRASRLILSLLESLLVKKLNKSIKPVISEHVLNQASALSRQLAQQWEGVVELCGLNTQIGGGAAPFQSYPTQGIALRLPGKASLHLEQLRSMPIPIIGYIEKERVRLNLATVLEQDKELFTQQLHQYLSQFQSDDVSKKECDHA